MDTLRVVIRAIHRYTGDLMDPTRDYQPRGLPPGPANATHASLITDEADAAAASQAIHDVVVAVRTSQPLA